MKKIILLFMIIALFGCAEPESSYSPPDENQTDDTPSEPLPVIPDPEPEPDPAISPVILALYDGVNLNYYDGSDFTTAYESVDFQYAGNKTGSIGDILHYFDEYGASGASYQLPGTPDHLLAVQSGSRAINGTDDIWSFETIDPATAQSLGALYRTYTKIHKNYTEFGAWYLNEYEVSDVREFNNRIILESVSSELINLSDSAVPYKSGPDFLITDIDFTNKRAVFNEIEISFTMNYFYTSKWQKCGDIFQSQHGLIFSTTDGITEGATALQDFISMDHPNGENYSLWPAGSRIENSESVSYWIDSTSGWLVRYIPSIDSYGMPVRLFVGPMSYATGNTLAPDITPQWIDDKLYFHWSGSVFTYDPGFGTVQVFSDDMEVLAW